MAPRKAFLLRIDPRLHDALRRWAEDDFRSLNSQIEVLLRESAAKAGRLKENEPNKPARPADPSTDD
jgi:hypothetical protein